ncbi:hypothetical protein HDU76_008046 [Blyttiomyces sp. JEL0837]|nr:hypothetical protein HDU76_008046 [Blyttiomyces sp. JEL0837]
MPVLPMMTARPPKAIVLSTFRGLMREVEKQYTSPNKNTVWKDHLISVYRQNAGLQDDRQIARNHLDATDILAFMKATREHKRLMEEYWPTVGISESERIERTAKTVGLNLPAPLRDDETPEAGGKTFSEMRESMKDTARREIFPRMNASATSPSENHTTNVTLENAATIVERALAGTSGGTGEQDER